MATVPAGPCSTRESFPKKTNQRDEDWTDVQDAIAVLNESRANAPVWRTRLEARFAVSDPSCAGWLSTRSSEIPTRMADSRRTTTGCMGARVIAIGSFSFPGITTSR